MIDTMKQALEALEPYARQVVEKGDGYETAKCDPKVDTAITALRLAIEQAEQQEPVCEYCGGDRFTAPPQRQPLTDEQLKPIADEYRILFGGWVVDFARAIERAHGIGGGE